MCGVPHQVDVVSQCRQAVKSNNVQKLFKIISGEVDATAAAAADKKKKKKSSKKSAKKSSKSRSDDGK